MATENLDSANLKAVPYGGLIREDVMDRIWDISKIPLPLTDMLGTTSTGNSYKEWTTDELEAPDTGNAHVDGIATNTMNDTQVGARVGNHCQISLKVVQVSTRANESDTIGRQREFSYQIMRRQQALRRDVEAIMLTQQASQADDGNTIPGNSAGLGAWLTTSVDWGAGGSAGGFANGIVAAPTVGTHRALTEALVRDISELVYNEGGDPSVLMTLPKIKRKFSEYLFTASARVATLYSDVQQTRGQATASGSVDVFVSDFNTLTLVPNRLQPNYKAADATTDVGTVYIIDPMYLSQCFLHGYRTEPLAKDGLSEKSHVVVDWTLIVNTEKAHGLIGSVDPSQDVTDV